MSKWTHDVPTKVEVYLRLNPVLFHYKPSKVIVFEIDGKICVDGKGIIATRLSEWDSASHFLWHGPIDPPKKREGKWIESGKRKRSD